MLYINKKLGSCTGNSYSCGSGAVEHWLLSWWMDP